MPALRRLLYLAAGLLATTRPFRAFHRACYRLSRGRLLGRSMGCQVVLLTTRGARTGAPRTAPVFAFPEGRTLIVVASNAGKARHPAWYLNLRAHPEARVQRGGETWTVRAREAGPAERERLWPTLAARYGGYEVYRARTARRIPVVILEPVG